MKNTKIIIFPSYFLQKRNNQNKIQKSGSKALYIIVCFNLSYHSSKSVHKWLAYMHFIISKACKEQQFKNLSSINLLFFNEIF